MAFKPACAVRALRQPVEVLPTTAGVTDEPARRKPPQGQAHLHGVEPQLVAAGSGRGSAASWAQRQDLGSARAVDRRESQGKRKGSSRWPCPATVLSRRAQAPSEAGPATRAKHASQTINPASKLKPPTSPPAGGLQTPGSTSAAAS